MTGFAKWKSQGKGDYIVKYGCCIWPHVIGCGGLIVNLFQSFFVPSAALWMQASAFTGIWHQEALCFLQDPFTFSPYHEAIREPFDYYVFGQKYIRPLIDFRLSFDLDDVIYYLLLGHCWKSWWGLGQSMLTFVKIDVKQFFQDMLKVATLTSRPKD